LPSPVRKGRLPGTHARRGRGRGNAEEGLKALRFAPVKQILNEHISEDKGKKGKQIIDSIKKKKKKKKKKLWGEYREKSQRLREGFKNKGLPRFYRAESGKGGIGGASKGRRTKLVGGGGGGGVIKDCIRTARQEEVDGARPEKTTACMVKKRGGGESVQSDRRKSGKSNQPNETGVKSARVGKQKTRKEGKK